MASDVSYPHFFRILNVEWGGVKVPAGLNTCALPHEFVSVNLIFSIFAPTGGDPNITLTGKLTSLHTLDLERTEWRMDFQIV